MGHEELGQILIKITFIIISRSSYFHLAAMFAAHQTATVHVVLESLSMRHGRGWMAHVKCC